MGIHNLLLTLSSAHFNATIPFFFFLPEIHRVLSHTFTLSEDPKVSLNATDLYRCINPFRKVRLGAVDNGFVVKTDVGTKFECKDGTI